MTNNSSPVFRKVIFKQNVNLNPDWEGGGAVSARNYSRPSFYYCIFDGNTVQRNGDTQNEANGGAVWIQSSSQSSQQFVLFDGCTFKNNVARGKWGARGGAIRTYQAQVLITNSLFYGNMTFANEDGTNTHSSNGGAIHITGPSYYSSNEQQWVGSQVKIINSTIVNNLTKTGSNNLGLSGSGIYLDSWGRSEKAWFFNNIVWGNKTSTDGSMQQIYFSNESGWGGKYLNYNVVQRSEAIASMQDDNSFETDPTFSDSTNGDYSLANSSILIGKGGASYEGVSAPNTDLLGLSRPNPYGSSPDIGAYENNLAITPYPAPVKNLTAVGGSGSVTLTWDAAADADSVYKVYKRDGAAFSIAAAYYLDKTTENNYTITGLDNDTRYYFRVAAVNKEGYEGTSAAIDITPTYSGPVWWVSTAGNDDNEGSSGSPFKSIEHAIGRVTAGDTVMLKQGTYTGFSDRGIEISTNDQEINFDNFKNVVITSEKGPDSTIIDADYKGNHFVLSGSNNQGLDSTFQFIGLTFANGRSNYPGGSFVIQGGNGGMSSSRPKMQPKFENCIFKNNEAKSSGNNQVSGGAIYISAATPIFVDCLFENNRAWGAGGAIDIQQMSSITDTTWIRNTVFRNNISHNEGNSKVGAVEGGAIKVSQGINLIISGSNFNNNQAIRYSDDDWQGVWGGAIQIGRGWDTKTNPLIRIYNSRFSKNKSINYAETQANGGAINAGAPIWIANSVIDSNLVTSANSAGGGALRFNIEQNGNIGTCYLINNTIIHNVAVSSNGNGQGRAGAISIYGTKGIWFNNIFWGNDSDQEPGGKAFAIQDINDISQNYNNFEYKDEMETLSGLQFGENTYSFEPGFYSATNYQLSTGSPLIGAGTSSYEGQNAPGKDILGNDRPNPSGSNPDLGAYENSLAESPYPKQVNNLVGASGSRQVSLRWDANTETDIQKYLVYMSTTIDFDPTSADSVDETTSTSYTVTDLENGKEYFFKVAAVNSQGYRGSFSQQLSITPTYKGPEWWVDDLNGSNNNDGSQNSPFKNIDHALTKIASGDTLVLLPGSHAALEILIDDKEVHFRGSTGDYRDVKIAANFSGRLFTVENTIATFKHITFTEGSSVGGNSASGGALSLRSNSDVEIVNCHFWNNQSTNQDPANTGFMGGGAVAVFDAKRLVFKDCVFRDNSLNGAVNGSAVFITHPDNAEHQLSPVFERCYFVNNRTSLENDLPNEFWGGGALSISGTATPRIEYCIFDSTAIYHNWASQGETFNLQGGAVWISGSYNQ
ncbi:fibronectin type III domain-containing protein, partial [Candidatus Marinimicrobia bacterium]|nr:fibronectin type III domain-containing protein [Candidatus Neomarinimicrobiota bacterium]